MLLVLELSAAGADCLIAVQSPVLLHHSRRADLWFPFIVWLPFIAASIAGSAAVSTLRQLPAVLPEQNVSSVLGIVN